MSIRRTLADRAVLQRKAEEAAFAQALEEFHSGKIRVGVMAKALAESGGDEAKAKAAYIALAAKAIQDDAYLEQREVESNREREVTGTRSSDSDDAVFFVGSFLIPGISQLVQHRYLVAAAFFFLAVGAWFLLLGWVVHILAGAEAMIWQRNNRD